MSARRGPLVGVVGAGIGGLAAAIALRGLGWDVVVVEQAPRFARVGADINLTPNAVRTLDGLGLGAELRRTAAQPTHRISRTWDTGEETSRLEMAHAAEQQYGAPQLTMHRADLLAALAGALPDETVRLGHRLTGLRTEGDRTVLQFADAADLGVDVLVGADGIHSAVRTWLFGPEQPEFTGVVSYRAVVPAARLAVPDMDSFTKWWGPDLDTQIVTFPLNRHEDVFVFATRPRPDWRQESWTAPGDVDELRHAYRDFHPDARALLDACDEVLASALYVRDPLPRWSVGSRTLLGDACHPMMPFMAQGAAMAIEDAVVLARALADAPDDVAGALVSYEAARRPRTARIQIASRGNDWLRDSGTGEWVYGYDASSITLTDHPLPAGPTDR